jgi:hypothetical protein
MVWVQVTLFILGLLAIGITFIVIYATRDKSKDIKLKPNMPKVYNLARREFTEGYTEGLLLKQIPRKNGCTLIEFFPTDIDQLDKKEEIRIQAIVVNSGCVKHLSRGEGSSRRENVYLVARSNANLPLKMQDTEEGKWMTKEGQLAWINKTFGQMIQHGDEAIAEAMKEYARGEIPKNIMQHSREVRNKVIDQSLNNQTNEEKPKE